MRLRRITLVLVTATIVVSSCKFACAQRTELGSVDSAGVQGNNDSGYYGISISADGRFVAFESFASNLVSGDTNGAADVFVHDRLTGTTERVSIDSAGMQANGIYPSISGDGQFVAFESAASNLVSGDTNGAYDVFVHDRKSGTTERVSVDSAGTQGNSDCIRASISADGRFVAFDSYASNLVSGDTNQWSDVFVHDRQTGTTERVSVDSAGTQGDGGSGTASITADGRFVAFESSSTNLVPGDTNGGGSDVFVHDRQTGITERVSVDTAGTQANSWSASASISADGRFVAFQSFASNLVPGDTNGTYDIFVHDRQTGTTERVSVDSAGTQASGASVRASISGDGRFVSFVSSASDLVSGDTNGTYDVFVHDRESGATRRVSIDSMKTEGNDESGGASISIDGRSVAFASFASNLVSGDTNGTYDVFVHGPYLTLEADPHSPPAGATLTFSTWTGAAGGLSLLVVTDINGTSLFVPVMIGAFDTNGLWTLSGTVPSGLSGTVATFETFGIIPTGKVGASNLVAVSFQ